MLIRENYLLDIAKKYGLSDKELEVLSLAIAGKPNKEIAEKLDISPEAVRKRLAHVYSRFDLGGRGTGKMAKLQQIILSESQAYQTGWEKNVDQKADNYDFYVEHGSLESLACQQILQPGCLLRIKAPWQMGKTSLMSRVLNYAASQGYRTVALNLRLAERNDFQNLDLFLRWFCSGVAVKLGLTHSVEEHWDNELGNSKLKCMSYFQDYVLAEDRPLALALDDLDRLFPYEEIAGEFLGMLRTCHEEAKTSNIWKNLRLVLVHTENYTHISVNQSPFNAGTLIELPELSPEAVRDLMGRYELDWDGTQVEQLMDLVGGHPYLVQLALTQVAQQKTKLEVLLETAATEAGIYGEHLRRYLLYLKEEPELAKALNQVVKANGKVELDLSWASKLQELGLVRWQNNYVTIRCELYRKYFPEHLRDSQ